MEYAETFGGLDSLPATRAEAAARAAAARQRADDRAARREAGRLQELADRRAAANTRNTAEAALAEERKEALFGSAEAEASVQADIDAANAAARAASNMRGSLISDLSALETSAAEAAATEAVACLEEKTPNASLWWTSRNDKDAKLDEE